LVPAYIVNPGQSHGEHRVSEEGVEGRIRGRHLLNGKNRNNPQFERRCVTEITGLVKRAVSGGVMYWQRQVVVNPGPLRAMIPIKQEVFRIVQKYG